MTPGCKSVVSNSKGFFVSSSTDWRREARDFGDDTSGVRSDGGNVRGGIRGRGKGRGRGRGRGRGTVVLVRIYAHNPPLSTCCVGIMPLFFISNSSKVDMNTLRAFGMLRRLTARLRPPRSSATTWFTTTMTAARFRCTPWTKSCSKNTSNAKCKSFPLSSLIQ